MRTRTGEMTDEQVQAVLDKIRPALQADGGDVELVGVEDGVVKVKLTGALPRLPDVAAHARERRGARPQAGAARGGARRARLASYHARRTRASWQERPASRGALFCRQGSRVGSRRPFVPWSRPLGIVALTHYMSGPYYRLAQHLVRGQRGTGWGGASSARVARACVRIERGTLGRKQGHGGRRQQDHLLASDRRDAQRRTR